jgi:myo-inositol-1(or 4)-monophosphatase
MPDVSETDRTQPAPDPGDLGTLAVRLAAGAAERVRTRLAEGGGHGAVDAKSNATDLVTEVDRDTEAWLVAEILRARPEDGVLGEEGGERRGSSGVRWVLDPIDGTVNFVLGMPQFAISVAAEVAGAAVAGAVANPMSGELFHAVSGRGAFLGDQRLRGPRDVPLSRAVVGTGFGYDRARRARQAAVVARLIGQVADIRRMGAAALDLCAVAAGRLDAYFEAGLNRWDSAAGGLIATESGCVVSGLRGREADLAMTAAAGTGLAAEFFALLESLDADRVG